MKHHYFANKLQHIEYNHQHAQNNVASLTFMCPVLIWCYAEWRSQCSHTPLEILKISGCSVVLRTPNQIELNYRWLTYFVEHDSSVILSGIRPFCIRVLQARKKHSVETLELSRCIFWLGKWILQANEVSTADDSKPTILHVLNKLTVARIMDSTCWVRDDQSTICCPSDKYRASFVIWKQASNVEFRNQAIELLDTATCRQMQLEIWTAYFADTARNTCETMWQNWTAFWHLRRVGIVEWKRLWWAWDKCLEVEPPGRKHVTNEAHLMQRQFSTFAQAWFASRWTTFLWLWTMQIIQNSMRIVYNFTPAPSRYFCVPVTWYNFARNKAQPAVSAFTTEHWVSLCAQLHIITPNLSWKGLQSRQFSSESMKGSHLRKTKGESE